MVTALSVIKVAVPDEGGQMIRPCLLPDAPTIDTDVVERLSVLLALAGSCEWSFIYSSVNRCGKKDSVTKLISTETPGLPYQVLQ